MVITIKEEDKSKFIDLSMFDESNLIDHLAKYLFFSKLTLDCEG